MDGPVQVLVDSLELKPHPEGGFYREVFRSARKVRPADSRTERQALTAIYFLLPAGQHSRWHRVLSDELWCHLGGGPLELLCFDDRDRRVTPIELGPYSVSGVRPMHAVPAGVWQAARPRGDYALAGCFVGPGFDFRDFRLAADDPGVSAVVAGLGTELASLL